MINAWSLLYEELNGTMDETYPIKTEGKMTDKNKEDVTVFGGSAADTGGSVADTINFTSVDDTVTFTVPEDAVGAADTISIDFGGGSDTLNFGTPLPGGMGEDHISFNVSTGLANTAYDDPKYYATPYTFGDDPYPTLGDINDVIGLETTASAGYVDDVYKFHFPGTEKPQPDLTREQTQKYGEDKGIADLQDYVSSTYSGHYTSKNNNVQTLDLIQSVGDAESFCRSNAIKYLSRYDKKGQAKKDILKAMHYCLLLYYFSGNTQEPDYTNARYETF